jgi:hypothetical protein
MNLLWNFAEAQVVCHLKQSKKINEQRDDNLHKNQKLHDNGITKSGNDGRENP